MDMVGAVIARQPDLTSVQCEAGAGDAVGIAADEGAETGALLFVIGERLDGWRSRWPDGRRGPGIEGVEDGAISHDFDGEPLAIAQGI